jgi:hypothetical protein
MEEVQCYLFTGTRSSVSPLSSSSVHALTTTTDLLLLIAEQQSKGSPRVERTCRHRLPLLTLSLPSSLASGKGTHSPLSDA